MKTILVSPSDRVFPRLERGTGSKIREAADARHTIETVHFNGLRDSLERLNDIDYVIFPIITVEILKITGGYYNQIKNLRELHPRVGFMSSAREEIVPFNRERSYYIVVNIKAIAAL